MLALDPLPMPDPPHVLFTCALQGARAVLASYPASIEDDIAAVRGGSLGKGTPEEAAVAVGVAEHACAGVAARRRALALAMALMRTQISAP